MKANELIPATIPIPEEKSLVRRAKSGEADAFIHLVDAYGDDLYRYVYFRALSDVAAEAITSQVFRHAWDHLDSLPRKGKTFVECLYDMARNQVIIYYSSNLRSPAFNVTALTGATDYRLDEATPDWVTMPAWSDHLRLLTGDIEQSRLQTTAALIMRRYLEYLNPGRVMRPSPTFNAYTRAWLIRYLQFHPRKPRLDLRREWARLGNAMLTRAQWAATYRPLPAAGLRRVAMTAAMLIVALVITGTARAQGALPGDPLYPLKRTTEQALLTVAPDHVGVELFLADRRLSEWIQVEHDPARSASALDNYYQAIAQLNMAEDTQTLGRIVPVLQAHKKKLDASGISSPQLDTLLAVAAVPATSGDVAVLPPTSIPPAAPRPSAGGLGTGAPTTSVNGVSESPTTSPTPAAPTATATATATDVPPTATPTATFTPTEIPTDTPTSTPTDVPATATPSPTEIVPTDTPYPTDTPFPTDTPTDVVPTATDTPSAADGTLTP